VEAHESEVLSVDFSNPLSGAYLLASSGKDNLIHVFDIEQSLAVVQVRLKREGKFVLLPA
jgi:WD40 repeat protein